MHPFELHFNHRAIRFGPISRKNCSSVEASACEDESGKYETRTKGLIFWGLGEKIYCSTGHIHAIRFKGFTAWNQTCLPAIENPDEKRSSRHCDDKCPFRPFFHNVLTSSGMTTNNLQHVNLDVFLSLFVFLKNNK